MKTLFFIISLTICFNTTSFGQKLNSGIICSYDTLNIEAHISIKSNPNALNRVNMQPYKVVQCSTRAKLGFRMDLAFSNYYYGNKTTNWIGQHGGPNFNFILVHNQLNFGFRFKPCTIDPKKELDFNGQTLPTTAKLNNVRLDYYVGYSLDFEKLISIEPYLGYNRTLFLVINEKDLNQEFSINKTGGLIIGTTLNKYFKLKDYGYIAAFGTIGYGFVDYKKVHSELDNGYFEWNIGVALKSFGTKRFNKRLD